MKLFLDISSTCTGYVLASEVGNIATIEEAGVIWFEKDATIAEKCAKIYDFVGIKSGKDNWGNWEIVVDLVVYERFSFNMKNPNGSLSCPQMQGAVFAASAGAGIELEDITPQTWRKNCGLKKKKEENWKQVVEAYFRAKWELPEKIDSNVTGNLRTTPSDYYDALGICEGWYKGKGMEVKFNGN